ADRPAAPTGVTSRHANAISVNRTPDGNRILRFRWYGRRWPMCNTHVHQSANPSQDLRVLRYALTSIRVVSPRRALLLRSGVLALGLAGAASSCGLQTALLGCRADKDCKLDRICDAGHCVWPRPRPGATANTYYPPLLGKTTPTPGPP